MEEVRVTSSPLLPSPLLLQEDKQSSIILPLNEKQPFQLHNKLWPGEALVTGLETLPVKEQNVEQESSFIDEVDFMNKENFSPICYLRGKLSIHSSLESLSNPQSRDISPVNLTSANNSSIVSNLSRANSFLENSVLGRLSVGWQDEPDIVALFLSGQIGKLSSKDLNNSSLYDDDHKAMFVMPEFEMKTSPFMQKNYTVRSKSCESLHNTLDNSMLSNSSDKQNNITSSKAFALSLTDLKKKIDENFMDILEISHKLSDQIVNSSMAVSVSQDNSRATTPCLVVPEELNVSCNLFSTTIISAPIVVDSSTRFPGSPYKHSTCKSSTTGAPSTPTGNVAANGSPDTPYQTASTPSKTPNPVLEEYTFQTPSHTAFHRDILTATPYNRKGNGDNTTRFNPFDSCAEMLQMPTVSPSLFKEVISPSTAKEDTDFRWSIEQIALLNPASIELPSSHFETPQDPDYERKAQDAIDKYFSRCCVLPSPWTCSIAKNKMNKDSACCKYSLPTNPNCTPVLPCNSKYRICSGPAQCKVGDEERTSCTNTSVSCQTDLSLPFVLPPQLAAMLAPYMNNNANDLVDNDISESSFLCNNTSLRRRLLFSNDELLSSCSPCVKSVSHSVDLKHIPLIERVSHVEGSLPSVSQKRNEVCGNSIVSPINIASPIVCAIFQGHEASNLEESTRMPPSRHSFSPPSSNAMLPSLFEKFSPITSNLTITPPTKGESHLRRFDHHSCCSNTPNSKNQTHVPKFSWTPANRKPGSYISPCQSDSASIHSSPALSPIKAGNSLELDQSFEGDSSDAASYLKVCKDLQNDASMKDVLPVNEATLQEEQTPTGCVSEVNIVEISHCEERVCGGLPQDAASMLEMKRLCLHSMYSIQSSVSGNIENVPKSRPANPLSISTRSSFSDSKTEAVADGSSSTSPNNTSECHHSSPVAQSSINAVSSANSIMHQCTSCRVDKCSACSNCDEPRTKKSAIPCTNVSSEHKVGESIAMEGGAEARHRPPLHSSAVSSGAHRSPQPAQFSSSPIRENGTPTVRIEREMERRGDREMVVGESTILSSPFSSRSFPSPFDTSPCVSPILRREDRNRVASSAPGHRVAASQRALHSTQAVNSSICQVEATDGSSDRNRRLNLAGSSSSCSRDSKDFVTAQTNVLENVEISGRELSTSWDICQNGNAMPASGALQSCPSSGGHESASTLPATTTVAVNTDSALMPSSPEILRMSPISARGDERECNYVYSDLLASDCTSLSGLSCDGRQLNHLQHHEDSHMRNLDRCRRKFINLQTMKETATCDTSSSLTSAASSTVVQPSVSEPPTFTHSCSMLDSDVDMQQCYETLGTDTSSFQDTGYHTASLHCTTDTSHPLVSIKASGCSSASVSSSAAIKRPLAGRSYDTSLSSAGTGASHVFRVFGAALRDTNSAEL